MKKHIILTLILIAATLCSLAATRTLRLSTLTHTLDESGGGNFDNVVKYQLVYNPSSPARVDSFYTFSWDTEHTFWFRTEFRQISYNPSGEYALLLEDTFQPGYPPYRRYSRHYNDQNLLAVSNCEVFYNESWVSILRNNYNYTAGVLSSRDDYHYEVYSNTGHHAHNAYTLDTQGRIIEETRTYSADSLLWELDSSHTYTYLPDDESTGQEYAAYLAQIDMQSYLFDIPAYGKIINMVGMAMMDSVLTNSERISCTYDNLNRLQSVVKQHWGGDNWQNYRITDYSYDTQGYLQNVTRRYWNYVTENWAPVYERITLFWEQPTANEDDLLPPVTGISLTTYPNPFGNMLSCTMQSESKAPAEFSVYNLIGQKVRDFGIQTSSSITWDGKDNTGASVSNGIYFIRAEQDGKSVYRKVVKIK